MVDGWSEVSKCSHIYFSAAHKHVLRSKTEVAYKNGQAGNLEWTGVDLPFAIGVHTIQITCLFSPGPLPAHLIMGHSKSKLI